MVEVENFGVLLDKTIAYAKEEIKRNRIKEVVGYAISTVGIVGTSLYTRGIIKSPVMGCASVGLFTAGATMGIVAAKKVTRARYAMKRMIEDKNIYDQFDKVANENSIQK